MVLLMLLTQTIFWTYKTLGAAVAEAEMLIAKIKSELLDVVKKYVTKKNAIKKKQLF